MDKQIIDIGDRNEFTDCVKCGADLRNGPIPKNDKRYYGKHLHYSALIGMKMDPDEPEIVTHWKCPKCDFTIPRFGLNQNQSNR